MTVDLEELLAPRIAKHCARLFSLQEYKHAAREAMTQVELALKQKAEEGGVEGYGVGLVRKMFGTSNGIRLRVPLGDDLQPEAEKLFEGAFRYYRNYAAHDGSRIDHRTCLRILVLASELLDLIDASWLDVPDLGGVAGLVRVCGMKNDAQLARLLRLLDGYWIEDDVVDGFQETLLEKGFDPDAVRVLARHELIRYREEHYVPTAHESLTGVYPDHIGFFELTPLGKKVIAEVESSSGSASGSESPDPRGC